jgi:hypothetical protein
MNMAKLQVRGYTSRTLAMQLFFALVLFLSAQPSLAGDVANPVTEQTEVPVTVEKAHPDLFRLEQALTRKLDEKKDGRVTPDPSKDQEPYLLRAEGLPRRG